MPHITIDNQTIDVPPGSTVLDAAHVLGIEIPTLCFLKGYLPSTSCQVCLVKDRQRNQYVPSCATQVVDGMQVDSNTDEVRAMRRTALELLFSDHVGDCLAPCFFACPAHMDIPMMLRQIGERDVEQAIATVKQEIALPAVLGRVCSKPCEKGCRRESADGSVAVCELKRFVADADLHRPAPYCPPCGADTGKRIAVVGAGPTGLSAAYYLRQAGHQCVIFEKEAAPGGRLRTDTDASELPTEVLDAEIAATLRIGIELRCQSAIDEIEPLLNDFDAVICACGQVDGKQWERWGVQATARGAVCDKGTLMTSRHGVFAAGSAIRRNSLYVRSVADGKLLATVVDQFLRGEPVAVPQQPFSSRIRGLQADEPRQLVELVGDTPRSTPALRDDYTAAQAAEQADRCFSCGCVSHGNCRLETYAVQYEADPTRFAGPRKPLQIQHRPGGIRFEPHKCIKCELCVQIAARLGEPLGVSFVGRGFDVELAVPFEHTIEQGLTIAARACVEACPTGALTWR